MSGKRGNITFSPAQIHAHAAKHGLQLPDGLAETRALPPNAAPSAPKKVADSHPAGLAKPRGPITLPSGEAITFIIWGAPMGKPRMTQRDKWKKRPCVVRYRAWADSARAAAPANLPTDPLVVSWTAYLPMPASWRAKKKDLMRGTLHRQKPDRDNIDKAVGDSLWKEDSGIACGTLVKRWDDGQGARVVVQVEGV